ncbi:MAG: hypothetical protein AABZ16_04415, partial [candidate division NC10 bacterium]
MRGLNPVQRFALYGGLCIAGLSVVLGFASSFFLEAHMREAEWITTAEVVRFQVEEHQLASYLTDPARRQAPAGDRNAFQPLLSLREVVRIKLWDRDATILWSDDDRLIGRRFPENPEVRQALAGRASVAFKTLRKAEHEYQWEQFTKLAEIYVPIRSKTSGEILGVIEVYKLPARLFASIRRMRLVIWGIAVSGGVLLYVVLLPIVRR